VVLPCHVVQYLLQELPRRAVLEGLLSREALDIADLLPGLEVPCLLTLHPPSDHHHLDRVPHLEDRRHLPHNNNNSSEDRNLEDHSPGDPEGRRPGDPEDRNLVDRHLDLNPCNHVVQWVGQEVSNKKQTNLNYQLNLRKNFSSIFRTKE